MDNPNVWYEIGVRHALRDSGAVLTYALRDRLPFDLNGQRMMHYTLTSGMPEPATLQAESSALTEAIIATLGAWRGRKASPVYAALPNLQEPNWQSRIEVERRNERPGDIAEEPPTRLLAFEALRTAGDALLRLNRSRYAIAVLQRARTLDPDDVRARQLEAIALGRIERYAEAAEALRRLAEEQRAAGQPSGETRGLLARNRKDDWRRLWEAQKKQGSDPLKAARDTAPSLGTAAAAYYRGISHRAC